MTGSDSISTGFIADDEQEARALATAWIEAEPLVTEWAIVKVYRPRPIDRPIMWRVEFDAVFLGSDRVPA